VEAENTPKNTRKLPPEMEATKWQKGQSGNPSGRPKKKPITEMYERILNNPEHLAAIEAATVSALKKGNMAMVLQLREITDRVEGKVSQDINLNGELTLADRISKARLARDTSGGE
jgi:hypothetical protein